MILVGVIVKYLHLCYNIIMDERMIGEGGFKSVYDQTPDGVEFYGTYLRVQETTRLEPEGAFNPTSYIAKFQSLRERCSKYDIRMVGDSVNNPIFLGENPSEMYLYDEREGGSNIVFGHESDSIESLGEFKKIYLERDEASKKAFWEDLTLGLHDLLGKASLAGIPMVTDIFGVKVNKETLKLEVFLMDFDNVELKPKEPTSDSVKAQLVTKNNLYIDRYIDRIKKYLEES
jgi:hypothetical protein